MSEYLSCLQAAKWMGVSQSTVKRLCDDGFFSARRTPGGHRRIRESDVRDWVLHQGHHPHGSVPARRRTPSNLTIRSAMDAAMNGSSEVLSSLFVKHLEAGASLSQLFDEIVAPAMWETGRLWQIGEIDVFQEHLCSNTMRSALSQIRSWISGRQANRITEGSPVAIGGCLGGEQHDLVSLMISLLLTDQGWRTHSLGAIVPTDSLSSAVSKFTPRLIWVSYTYIDNLDDIVRNNHRLFDRVSGQCKLVVGGQALTPDHRRKLRFDFAGDSFDHLLHYAKQVA
ncbi:MAG: B12-binding domain-containing protein [Planctomycetota bacterium]